MTFVVEFIGGKQVYVNASTRAEARRIAHYSHNETILSVTLLSETEF